MTVDLHTSLRWQIRLHAMLLFDQRCLQFLHQKCLRFLNCPLSSPMRKWISIRFGAAFTSSSVCFGPTFHFAIAFFCWKLEVYRLFFNCFVLNAGEEASSALICSKKLSEGIKKTPTINITKSINFLGCFLPPPIFRGCFFFVDRFREKATGSHKKCSIIINWRIQKTFNIFFLLSVANLLLRFSHYLLWLKIKSCTQPRTPAQNSTAEIFLFLFRERVGRSFLWIPNKNCRPLQKWHNMAARNTLFTSLGQRSSPIYGLFTYCSNRSKNFKMLVLSADTVSSRLIADFISVCCIIFCMVLDKKSRLARFAAPQCSNSKSMITLSFLHSSKSNMAWWAMR